MESDRLGQLHPEDKSVQLYKWLRITDELRQTVFHACCQHAYRQALWTIVQYCSPDMLREAFLDQDGLTKATPLHLAVTHHHYDMVKLLAISQVVDVNAKNENGDTPLHLALLFNDEFLSNEYVDLLLNLGNADTRIKNAKGVTPMKLAKKKGRLLIKKSESIGTDTSGVSNGNGTLNNSNGTIPGKKKNLW